MNPLVRDFLRDPKFAQFVANKQAIDHVFYDTKTILAAGLGAPAAPVPAFWFDGLTATDPTLTNIFGKNQMEQDEVAAIVGVSFTPLAVHNVKEGANAAAINGANISQDVDQVIKRSSVSVKIGTNVYGPWPAQSVGGDGGLQTADGLASTVAASVELRSAPSNGKPAVGCYWKFFHPILWFGNKQLIVQVDGATGAISANLNVRIGIHTSPLWRNFRPETGLRI